MSDRMCIGFKYEERKKYLTFTGLYQISRRRKYSYYPEPQRSPQKELRKEFITVQLREEQEITNMCTLFTQIAIISISAKKYF